MCVFLNLFILHVKVKQYAVPPAPEYLFNCGVKSLKTLQEKIAIFILDLDASRMKLLNISNEM